MKPFWFNGVRTFFFFYNKGAGVFCPVRLSVFTRQWWWKSYFFLCHLLRLYLWATSSPHSVVSEAAFWYKLFGFNEIIHLHPLEQGPSSPQTNNFRRIIKYLQHYCSWLIKCPVLQSTFSVAIHLVLCSSWEIASFNHKRSGKYLYL